MPVFVLLFAILFASQIASAQTVNSRADEVIAHRAERNKGKHSTSGYRVQIFFSDNRDEAIEAKNVFAAANPSINTYLIYQQPYFKVRVGDCHKRIDAQKLLQSVGTQNMQPFIVEDEINTEVKP